MRSATSLHEARSRRHLALVRRNLLALDGLLGLEREALAARAAAHDASKTSEPEREGYTRLTWRYHCRAQGLPSSDHPSIARAMRHHRRVNRHHPEFHACPGDMRLLDIVEMVCDWEAINQENAVESTRSWAERNLARWAFPRSKVRVIYRAIAMLETSRRSNTARIRPLARALHPFGIRACDDF
jgi:hypothetical protein